MTWIILATAAVGGLLIGSFLNVVIHRGPALWKLTDGDRNSRGGFAAPRSYCPACRKQIRWFDLFPIISFIVLRGKCRECGAPIALRYPVVEFLGAAAALVSVAVFGATWDAALAALFLLTLIALAFIDHETGYLPDALTLPLLAAGLAANITGRFVSLKDAAIGAAAGYLAFLALAAGYRALRGREGLGWGDAKLLAALGAWCGWVMLPPIVLAASVMALALAAAGALTGRKIDAATPIRFGPALCAAGAAGFLALKFGGAYL